MKPFWPIVVGVLFLTLCVWPSIVADLVGNDISYHATQRTRRLLIYPATVLLLAVVWAICFRPQLERGRLSLAALLVLVTVLAAGLAVARYSL